MESSTKSRTITFTHVCPNQVMFVRKPEYLRDSRGDRIGEDAGKSVVFEDNFFHADEAVARDLEFYVRDPETGEVINPLNPTGDLDALADWLRAQDHFGSKMFEDSMPEELQPTVQEQTATITAAFTRQDPEAIQAVIDLERDTHRRDAVIHVGTGMLKSLADLE